MNISKDREILAIALPALGALAADPLLSMVDTAMVGHLGAAPLAALGIATVAFSMVFVVFNFLAYGTTGPFARLSAAGRSDDAVRHVVQALWVALSLGLVSTVAGLVLSRPVGYLLGARGEVLTLFLAYFRIRILALTPMLIVLVGHGLFRGLLDTRTPLAITVSANVVNALLGFVLIYPVGLGVRGAAIGTVVAQSGACALFAWQMWRHLHPLMPPGAWRPHREAMRALLLLSRDLLIRTFSLNGVFVLSTAMATRMGTTVVAGHQVAVELWMFLAMVMDSIAIAGQALTGRYLGAGRTDEADRTAKRMLVWGVLFGAVLGAAYWLARGLLPRIFTNDADVIAGVALVLPFIIVFQPLNGFVFVLDGILIGASDSRYLARGMLVSAGTAIPIVLLALRFEWGLRGIWTGLSLFMVMRAITNGLRFRSGNWLHSGEARVGRAGGGVPNSPQ